MLDMIYQKMQTFQNLNNEMGVGEINSGHLSRGVVSLPSSYYMLND